MDQSSPEPLYRAVGEALASWGRVELALGAAFVHMSGIGDSDKARAIFDGIISFDIRLSIIDRIISFEKISDLEKEMWLRLSAKLTKFYKKRHELAHFGTVNTDGMWLIVPFLTWEKIFSFNQNSLPVKQIKERIEKFDELAEAIEWFNTHAVYRRIYVLGDPPPSSGEPPLVPRLRALATQILEERKPPPQSWQG